MAVPTGTASLLDIQNEFGGSNPISLSEYRGVGPGPASGAISINNFRGASNAFAFTISSNTADLVVSTAATAAGWNGSSPINVTVNSGIYIYSTNTANAGMTIDVAGVTLTNNGKIMGMGGDGGHGQVSRGSYNGGNGQPGGPAISAQVANVTIINNSGAFIAGGGGGGGGSGLQGSDDDFAGGGGGAGGGRGGAPLRRASNMAAGGAIGQAGNRGVGRWGYGHGGGAGGEGGSSLDNHVGGGGGGRILPGVGGTGNSGPDGGSAGNPGGDSATHAVYAAGGGGWGARGGLSLGYRPGDPGAGGAAISGSVTLTNNGTVYGST